MPTNHGGSGVSNFCVFKIRLQEYTHRVGLPNPVYETTEYGPFHEPFFRSQVTLDDITYKSLPGFFDRQTAEYSAAEVALVELAKCGAVEEEHIPETVLCKNLVQEYAQKMNYAIPIYQCNKNVEATVNEAGRLARFCCTVEIGGIRYIGGAARNKKQARIKAARTALLAIKKTESESSGKPIGNSQFSVIPCKKRAMESANKPEETGSVPKAKKARLMKEMSKRKILEDKTNDTQIEGSSKSIIATGTHQEGSKGDQTNAHGVQVEGSAEATRSCQEGRSDVEPIDGYLMFKSRLQEYTDKVGLATPVYETTEEGRSHEPLFRSQVTVNDITYKSLSGFFNRKAAEQSAAKVALVELAKCSEVKEHVSQPVHETGLCKSLVQEYAHKMNYAIPIYQCKNVEATGNEAGRLTHFCCTVEIGGIRYTGGTARTKKEAEIKAARTALLAIQTTEPGLSGKPIGNSQLSAIPCKKRATESATKPEETGSVPKAKKARFMEKTSKKKIYGDETNHTQIEGSTNKVIATGTHQEGSKGDQTNAHGVQVEGSAEATRSCQEGISDVEPIDGYITTRKGVSNCCVFKIRLNEYAQRVGLPKPVYETTEYRPSHERLFRSQVTVNGITYKSLPGFFNRKAAEQSAAEVALVELAKCGAAEAELIPETVVYKKLQEYAQKMNYATPPIYQGNKIVEATVNEAGGLASFCCTVEIGGIRYIGGAARTRKQARIKAARIALLAIKKTEPESSGKPIGNSQFSVIPCKKRAIESANKPEETGSVPKPKKAQFMKNDTQIEGSSNSVIATGTHQEVSKGDQTNAHGVQVEGSAEATRSFQEGRFDVEPIDGDITTQKGTLTCHIAGDSQNVQSNATDSNQSNHKEPDVGKSSISNGDITALRKEMNEMAGNGEMVSMVAPNHAESSYQTSASQVKVVG
ncbi:hypothetical protein LWI29_024767 [Acer saccharum]|uniref:DRBM domain-containing protein n=1 Tax=Acer saccharum TaxID=4024 RepID=A0AA39V2P6_ACESA|nr:hypothetical protein LWI29_024767 [Acer saccharum]